MGKKDQKEKERVEAVLELLRKQAPLTVKQVGVFVSFTVSDECGYCSPVSVAFIVSFLALKKER